MFPLSHLYIAKEVTGRTSPLLTLGSILPDTAWVSPQEFAGWKIHEHPREFHDFVKNNFLDLLDLGIAVRLHSHIGQGADFYSDDPAAGYAKIEGRKISPKLAEILKIPEGEQSLVLSHNIVEAAVDLNLEDHDPGFLELYRLGLKEFSRPAVIKLLADYLEKEKSLVENQLEAFLEYFGPAHLASAQAIVEKIALPLISSLRLSFDSEKAITLLDETKEAVKDSYLPFLEKTVREMKQTFREFC